MNEEITVRFEQPEDVGEVDRVMRRAFPGPEEAGIVEGLRKNQSISCCVVAETSAGGEDGLDGLVGALVFSPVSIQSASGEVTSAWGLGPMAVIPERQRAGVGEAMFDHWRQVGPRPSSGIVVVLGHASYYPRFGFRPASRFGIRWEHPCPDEAFMVLETESGAANEVSGVVSYDPAFG